eukprot:767392-Hanusia_phi.AAC.1
MKGEGRGQERRGEGRRGQERAGGRKSYEDGSEPQGKQEERMCSSVKKHLNSGANGGQAW